MEQIFYTILSGAVSAGIVVVSLKIDMKWVIGTLKRHDQRISKLEEKKGTL